MALPQKKIIVTLVLLSSGILNLTGILDQPGEEHINASFKRALYAFAIARGLNAVLSVAQGTEISVEPMGLGLTFTPGEILDPINDLIERFSWVMLASSTAIGIQEILLSISLWSAVIWLISGLITITIVLLWVSISPKVLANRLAKISLIIIFIRLSIPAVFVLNEMAYRRFLSSKYQQSTHSIEYANSQLNELTTVINQSTQLSVAEKPSNSFLEDLMNSINVKAKIESEFSAIKDKMRQIEKIASDMTRYIINLIVVFTLQSLIFPTIFLIFIYKTVVLLSRIELI